MKKSDFMKEFIVITFATRDRFKFCVNSKN